MKRKPGLLCAAVLSLLACVVTAGPLRDTECHGAVKELKPLPSVLGAQWVSAYGLVSEELDDAHSHPAGEPC